MKRRGSERPTRREVTATVTRPVCNAGSLSTLLLLAVASGSAASASLDGRVVAQSQERGNCLACHRMPADPLAVTEATLGPVLQGVQKRFPDRAQLRAQIWDPAARNPDTLMPRYGRHRILTETEIDAVTDFIFGL